MGSSATGDQWSTEVLSCKPRISICHNFLTKEECEYLIKLGRPHMNRSLVADQENPGGVGKISSSRTSTGMFLTTQNDKVALAIRKRISDYTTMPIENGEGLQVLHYEVGQKFDAHHDYFKKEKKTVVGSQRVVTVIMYLSDVKKGGETFFPNAKTAKVKNYVRSTNKGIYVKPKMCDALLFWNLKPDGSEDPLTLHGSAPVIKGDKWACTLWLHDSRYQPVVASTIISPVTITNQLDHDSSRYQRVIAAKPSTLTRTAACRSIYNSLPWGPVNMPSLVKPLPPVPVNMPSLVQSDDKFSPRTPPRPSAWTTRPNI